MEEVKFSKTELDRAAAIQEKSIVINGQDATTLNVFEQVVTEGSNLTLYEEFMKGGLTGGIRSIYADEYVKDYYTPLWVPSGEECFRKMCDYLKYVREHPDKVILAVTAEDVEKAKKERKYALVLESQWPALISSASIPTTSSSLLHGYYAMGLRILQLAYNNNSLLADGCGEPRDAGISREGEMVIDEMNKLGMLIDLTHVGDRSSKEAIEYSKDPVAFTHSNARALCASKINKPDDLLKLVAEKGGMTGITGLSPRLRHDRWATIADFMDQIDYCVKLMGVDHVGFAMDYPMHYTPQVEPHISALKWETWKRVWPEYLGYARAKDVPKTAVPYKGKAARMADGLHSPVLWFDVTKHLVRRGYSDQEIQKILGLNYLSLFRRVFKK